MGPQSDQYALGILTFQMITGQVPFDADSLMTILQHHYFTPPPDVRSVRERAARRAGGGGGARARRRTRRSASRPPARCSPRSKPIPVERRRARGGPRDAAPARRRRDGGQGADRDAPAPRQQALREPGSDGRPGRRAVPLRAAADCRRRAPAAWWSRTPLKRAASASARSWPSPASGGWGIRPRRAPPRREWRRRSPRARQRRLSPPPRPRRGTHGAPAGRAATPAETTPQSGTAAARSHAVPAQRRASARCASTRCR